MIRRVCLVLGFIVCADGPAFASDGLVTSYNGRINDVVGGVIEGKAIRLGETVGSARTVSTFSGLQRVVSTTANVGAALVGVGTPIGWAGVLGRMVLKAGISGAVSLAADNSLKWMFDSSTQKVRVLDPEYIRGVDLSSGGDLWYDSCYGDIYGSNGEDVVYACLSRWNDTGLTGVSKRFEANGSVRLVDSGGGFVDKCLDVSGFWVPDNVPGGSGTICARRRMETSSVSCSGVSVSSSNTSCVPLASKYLVGPGYWFGNGTPWWAAQNMPQNKATKTLSSQFLAQGINQLWSDAASFPDYQGIPYDSANAVTSSDVDAYVAARYGSSPLTISDLAAPVALPGTVVGGSPQTMLGNVAIPASSGSGSGGSGGGGNVTVNMCGLPGQPACNINWGPSDTTPPSDPTPPSWNTFGETLWNNLAPLKTWSAPTHSGVCPTPTFFVFEHSYTIDKHCVLIEQFRQQLYVAFHLGWLLYGIFVLFSA